MKLIKNLITITILNFLLLASILQVGAQLTPKSEESISLLVAEPTPIVESTPAPTPTPIIIRRRVEVRKQPQNKTAPTQSPSTPTTSTSASNPPTSSTPVPQAPQPTSTPRSTGCIVSIDGVSYDVTNFRKMHGGGDIFSCGGDMSASFWSAHGQSTLQKMQKYRL